MRDLDGLWDNAQQSHKLIALVRNMDNKKMVISILEIIWDSEGFRKSFWIEV